MQQDIEAQYPRLLNTVLLPQITGIEHKHNHNQQFFIDTTANKTIISNNRSNEYDENDGDDSSDSDDEDDNEDDDSSNGSESLIFQQDTNITVSNEVQYMPVHNEETNDGFRTPR